MEILKLNNNDAVNENEQVNITEKAVESLKDEIDVNTNIQAVELNNQDNTYEELHYYRNFALPGNMSVSVDLFKQTQRCIFDDISNSNNLIRLNISHIYRRNGANVGYGKGYSLNLCEKISTISGNLYYTDGLGDRYLIKDGIAKNMAYTTTAPESVKNLFGNIGCTSWLVGVNYTRGFNADGNLVLISDTYGNHFQINYNSSNKISDVQDLRNNFGVNTFNFTYNSQGYLSKISDTLNKKEITYTYVDGSLVGITFSSGLSLTITYSDNYLTQVDVSDGYINKISSSGALNISTQSSFVAIPDGATSTNLPAINSWRITFGTQETWVDDIDGNKDVYRFADEGYLCAYFRQTDSVVMAAEQYKYVPRSYKKTFKAKKELLYKNGYTDFNFEYDEYITVTLNEFEQPIKAETKNIAMSENATADAVTTYTYNNEHRCTKQRTVVTMSLSSETKTYTQTINYTYNDKGKISKKESYIEEEVSANGKAVEEYTYSQEGYLTKTIAYNSLEPSNQFCSERSYDQTGKVTAVWDDAGQYKTQYKYVDSLAGMSAALNKLASVVYPDGSEINYKYNDRGVLSEVYGNAEVENKNVITYSNDEIIQLTSADDQIDFTYDNERRIASVNVGGSELQTISYLTRGAGGLTLSVKTTNVTNAKNEKFKYCEKTNHEYQEVYYKDSLILRCNYNKDGTLKSFEDPVTGKTGNVTYNSLGAPTQYTESADGETVYTEDFTYNDYGELSNKTESLGSTYSYVYEETAARRLSSIKGDSDIEVKIDYDKLGRNTGKKVYCNSNLICTEDLGYYGAFNKTTIRPNLITFNCASGTKTISYTYDSCGNIASVKDINGKMTYYKYDGLNRLVREDNQALGLSYYYLYDNKGNITGKESLPYTTDSSYMHAMATKLTYTYLNGRIVKDGSNAAISYDAIGNPKIYKGYMMSWTKGRQLIEYNVNDFGYDGLGRRIRKNAITYYYDSSDRLIKSSDGMTYFYDHTGVAGFMYNGARYVYQKDALGNIVAILDNTGATVVQYVYDAWGNHRAYDANNRLLSSSGRRRYATAPTQLCDINPFRYRGYFYDYETGLYYLKSRYYDPETGRFINMDNVDYADPEEINGLNLYAYCGNNPIMYIDPNGEVAISIGVALTIGGLLFVALVAGIEATEHPIQNACEAIGDLIADFIDTITDETSSNNTIDDTTGSNIGELEITSGNIVFSRERNKGHDSGFIGLTNDDLVELLDKAVHDHDSRLIQRILKEMKMRGMRNKRKNRNNPHMRGFLLTLLANKKLKEILDDYDN